MMEGTASFYAFTAVAETACERGVAQQAAAIDSQPRSAFATAAAWGARVMMRFGSLSIICLILSGCAEERPQPSDSVESVYNLGVDAYRAEDYAEAFEHWSAAAARGELNALNNLGFLLYNGLGVDQNQEEGISLWRIASFAGHAESQWHLASAYEVGEGVQQDLLKAYAWYMCAVESAAREVRESDESDVESEIIKDARNSIEELRGKLGATELVDAEALAAEYARRYAKAAP